MCQAKKGMCTKIQNPPNLSFLNQIELYLTSSSLSAPRCRWLNPPYEASLEPSMVLYPRFGRRDLAWSPPDWRNGSLCQIRCSSLRRRHTMAFRVKHKSSALPDQVDTYLSNSAIALCPFDRYLRLSVLPFTNVSSSMGIQSISHLQNIMISTSTCAHEHVRRQVTVSLDFTP